MLLATSNIYEVVSGFYVAIEMDVNIILQWDVGNLGLNLYSSMVSNVSSGKSLLFSALALHL